MPCRPSEREDASHRHGHRARATLKETPGNEATKSSSATSHGPYESQRGLCVVKLSWWSHRDRRGSAAYGQNKREV
eukprot:6760519-Heterocapsa_arctica.AAC.1